MNRALDESNAVHCLGNGKICAYAKGLDLFEIFGSYYSAPNGVSLLFNGDRELCLETKRKPETAIWTYEVCNAKESLGMLTEFADSTDPIVYRNIKFHQPMSFQLVADQVEKFYFVPEETLQIKNFYYGEIPEGTSFCIYSIDGEKRRGFVTDKVLYFGFVATGDACVTKEALTLLNIQISDGTMALFYGEDFYELVEYAQKVNRTDFSVHLQNTETWWLACSANRKRNYSVADRELAEMIDDTYVLIKTQQSCSGGVLACYPYHLAYIRDNYGVNRGLLAMGAYDESKALLKFYMDVFNRYGVVHNAQGMGSYAFHVHENDRTEITGYMILMFLEYYNTTGDAALLREAKDFLWWCVEQQHGILRKGMLPFNGDETYIAGFIIPREIINHGSMEATVLYHTACRGMMSKAELLDLTSEQITLMQTDMAQIEKNFEANFRLGDRLACNNPNYYGEGEQPLFRTGIRLCGHGTGIGILDKSQRYVCFDCYDKPARPNPDWQKRFFIRSSVLMAVYVGSELIDPQLLNEQIDQIAKELVQNDFVYKPDKTVGYDLGMLMVVFHKRHPKLLKPLKRMILEMRDDAGAWSEYYVNGLPSGTLYRPWESAINCETLLIDQR